MKKYIIQIIIFPLLFTLFWAPLVGSAPSPWPLGTLVKNSLQDPDCPQGYACTGFTVACPGVQQSINGFYATASASASPRGMVLFFTGGTGQTYYMSRDPTQKILPAFADDLRAQGFTIVQVRWDSPSWLVSAGGESAGTAHLGCRPATVIKHIHDTLYLPMNIAVSEVGRCGFCATGSSGGSAQVSYALSHYGLEGILNAVIPTDGPPFSVLAKSCLLNSGEELYQYEDGTRGFIDEGFGFLRGSNNGPCFLHDSSFTSRWNQESVATGGNDYYHPTTRIHFIFGSIDVDQIKIGGDYVDRLRLAGTPFLKSEIALNTDHGIYETDAGRTLLKNAILSGTGAPPPTPPPPPPSGTTPVLTTTLTVNHIFIDNPKNFILNGSNLSPTENFSFILKNAGGVIKYQMTVTSRDGSTIGVTFRNFSSLPAGFYSIALVRESDKYTITHPKQLLITKLGDLWSSGATETSEQKKDGKIDIHDVSRLLTKWNTNDTEADINPGPQNISQGKVDIYDANKLMGNWTS